MRVRPELSSAPSSTLELVQALAGYSGCPGELIRLATRLWPELVVYLGDTHLRFITTRSDLAESIYVDLHDDEAAKDRGQKQAPGEVAARR